MQTCCDDGDSRGNISLKLRSTVFLISVVAACAVFLIAVCLPFRTAAQTLPVIIAPGFEFNVFADATRVPDFTLASDPTFAYGGPVSMAFDARGRLFVGTYASGKI